jgi:peptide/nickel transport system permease protein
MTRAGRRRTAGGGPTDDSLEVSAAEVAESLAAGTGRRRPGRGSVVSYILTVFVLITFNFALPRLMPGDPIDALMAFGDETYVQNDKTRAALAEYYGLDASLPQQYLRYLGDLLQGDLGVSITSNQPVREELDGKIGWSFLLLAAGTVIAIAVGLPLGVHSGWKRGKRVDRGLLGFFLTVQNLPILIIGSVAFVLLVARLDLFPSSGATSAFAGYQGIDHVLDVGRHLILPATLLAFDFLTYEYLVMRSAMVGELGADYLLGGRAKGLRERRLKYRYAARNALLPVVTVIGLQFSLAVGTGLVIVESIFSYPGVGGYMIGSIGQRDYPAIQGAFLVITVTVVTTNLLVDLLYRRLDPRTRS